ncbi:uncharacterized protein LOC124916911 [Impatiens glandulifera]|uniref:uncharacterized protein LOC124916911 n=1 Tax=Impatiens glandulifera TaxID=253017 RepID=UPI001FB14960|nr:uncharacterized protein LOC124916911 [Impatiens glandulifera]
MGTSTSRIEDGRALQISRERKRLVKQAIIKRHALAKSHIAYIGSLRNLGNALGRLIEPEAAVESSPCGSTSTIIVKPLELATKDYAQDMKNRTIKPQTPPSETLPWDFFDLLNPKHDNFPSGGVTGKGLEKVDALRQFVKEKANHNLGVQEESFLPASRRKFLNIDMKKSPELSPLRALPSRFVVSSYAEEITTNEEDQKLRFLNVKEMEYLTSKVTDSGQDVYHLIEANKFPFHPPLTPRGRYMPSSLLKSCFSFKDPGNAKEETNGFLNDYVLLEGNTSTLDRLYAWENKLYNEVKVKTTSINSWLLMGKVFDLTI